MNGYSAFSTLLEKFFPDPVKSKMPSEVPAATACTSAYSRCERRSALGTHLLVLVAPQFTLVLGYASDFILVASDVARRYALCLFSLLHSLLSYRVT